MSTPPTAYVGSALKLSESGSLLSNLEICMCDCMELV